MNNFYLFTFNDDSTFTASCETPFKEVIYNLAVYCGFDYPLFCKSLNGFEDDDKEGLIGLANHWSHKSIEHVYIVDKQIF